MQDHRDTISAAGRTPVVETTEFNLLRYFSLTCLVLFVVVTTVMCTGFYLVAKRYIRSDAEQRAVAIAEQLTPLAFVGGQPVPLPDSPEYALLDEQLHQMLKASRVFKIKVYGLDGRIVYTTDSRIRLGRADTQNVSLQMALLGEVVSVLQTGKTVWDLDEEEKIAGAIVETYVPARADPSDASLRGVLEIYQDVTTTYGRLSSMIAIIVGVSVVAMGTLFQILYLAVRKADKIIRSQTRAITQAKVEVEGYASELALRVEERTRQLRESLEQQQHDDKMVAMGVLASGIAHELNTPLGTILGSAQLVLDHCSSTLDSAPETRPALVPDRCRQCVEDLEQVESQAKRCKEIIRSLVNFSRKSDRERSWEDLKELIERSLALVQPEARLHAVSVEIMLSDNLPSVLVAGNEIQQVLVNIMGNAIAAMPDGGTLGLSVGRVGQMARIEIRDTGTGIDEEKLHRIFEPFFTTKQVGKGTGLGLSISYRIVKDHGGRISVSSAVGKGSTFVIDLPIDVAKNQGARNTT